MNTFSEQDTIADALSRMKDAFQNAGIATPDVDARFLLQGIAGIDAAAIVVDPERRLGASAPLLNEALRRRLDREPVSRILGRRAFYDREFVVTPDVLDPRPDTEAVVNLALKIARLKKLDAQAISVADIGTGSGILIATLLLELGAARGIATDISAAALDVARANAQRLGVSDRIDFIESWGLGGACGSFDLIVSNPPYIPSSDIMGLDPEVRNHDPHIALDGGPDGLFVYREIAIDISGLEKGTVIVLEVGAGQKDDVCRIFALAGAVLIDEAEDLGGHTRAVAFERQ
jgi:release factor glutamine methyltransferase